MNQFVERTEALLANPDATHRTAARWWLAEGSHTNETLIESIQELKDYGFGAVEIVTLDESTYLDEAKYSWGSQEWIDDSRLIVEECTRQGMGVSFTSGTHWSNANIPTINPDEEAAAQELGYKAIPLSAGETFEGALPLAALPDGTTKQTLVAVVAAQIKGQNEAGHTLLDMNSLIVLTGDAIKTGGEWSLTYTAPDDGDSVLFVFWQYGTAQTASPSVETNYVINYLSEDGVNALKDYWDASVLTPELRQAIRDNGNVSMYMDSLELNVVGADNTGNLWCTAMLEEFRARRGYELDKYLPLLILDRSKMDPRNALAVTQAYWYEPAEDDGSAAKIRRDLNQTTTELYCDNCLAPLTTWLHENGMTLRAENSYGLLLEISQPIACLDYVEGESLEFGVEIERYRAQAGAAHLLGKVYSSETGAILGSNYWYDNDFYRQMFYTQFAAGVQKTVTHGYSSAYGPEGRVAWPGFEGMWDMFSERFNRRQPASLDYPLTWGQINRIQTILRQGVPQMDLAILRTDYNFNLTGDPGLGPNCALHQDRGIYWMDQTLQHAGYTYDYFSPYLLTRDDVKSENGLLQADGAAYQAVLLYQQELPLSAAEALLKLAENGLPVVLVTGPSDEQIRADELRHYEGAALNTGSLSSDDAALADVMARLTALENVVCVNSQAEAYDALRSMKVLPRVAFTDPNRNLLTVMRRDGDTRYLYVYNYMFEQDAPFSATLSIEGEAMPYVIDTWSGKVRPCSAFRCTEGRTEIDVMLAPGEVVMYVLDASADIPDTSEGKGAPASLPEIEGFSPWSLTVESWTAGDKLTRTEDKGAGYVTTEVSFDTKKTPIEVGVTELVPWKDIEAVGETVSGVGTYRADFRLPEDWDSENFGIRFSAESFGGGTARLWINGQEVPVNLDSCVAELSDAVRPGENTIEVRVTTSLRNVMMASGYADVGMWTFIHAMELAPAAYGMTGTSLTLFAR